MLRKRESHGNQFDDGPIEATDGLALVRASGADFPIDFKQMPVAQ